MTLKLGFKDDQINTILASLLISFEIIPLAGVRSGAQPDPDDEKILECAMAGQASHIVTGDRQHLLPLRRYQNVDVITPAELLRVIEPQTS